jgi:chromosome segregation ATPase
MHVCRLEEAHQDEGNVSTNTAVAPEVKALTDELRKKQHEISVLKDEVTALSMSLEQQVSKLKEQQTEWEQKLDTERGRLRAAEYERDDMAKQCNVHIRELQMFKDDKLQLQVLVVPCNLHGSCEFEVSAGRTRGKNTELRG